MQLTLNVYVVAAKLDGIAYVFACELLLLLREICLRWGGEEEKAALVQSKHAGLLCFSIEFS